MGTGDAAGFTTEVSSLKIESWRDAKLVVTGATHDDKVDVMATFGFK